MAKYKPLVIAPRRGPAKTMRNVTWFIFWQFTYDWAEWQGKKHV